MERGEWRRKKGKGGRYLRNQGGWKDINTSRKRKAPRLMEKTRKGNRKRGGFRVQKLEEEGEEYS